MGFGHAIYGERDRGHRLLSASESFPDPEALAGRMDMQGTPPPHTDWQPYLSGFRWNDHYVLARTTADVRSARSGMVFSRTLAVPADAIGSLHDIFGLMEFLSQAGDARAPATDVPWRPGSRSPAANAGLVQAALGDGASPVVWPGQEGFDEALAALWRHLWPAARLALEFRIAFSPTDVGNDPPTLVTTPVSLLSRWSGFRVVQTDAEVGAGTTAERYLLTGEGSESLALLLATLGDRLPSIPDLLSFVDVGALLATQGSLVDHIDALRRICHLAPDPSIAVDIKSALIAKATRGIPGAGTAEVRMARNLDLAAAATSVGFWNELVTWAATTLWTLGDAAGLSRIIADVVTDKPVAAWREAIGKGVRTALGEPSRAVAKAAWDAILVRPGIIEEMIGLAGQSRRLEPALVGAAPNTIAADVAEQLLERARNLSLWLLHASGCAASLPAPDAVRRHLADATVGPESLAIAAQRATGAELVAIALEREDPLTLVLAADAAARQPILLRALDVSNPRWRALWTRALSKSGKAADGPADAVATLTRLLDGTIDGAISDPELLTALSVTPLANVATYPRRAELWSALPSAARTGFLQTSADGWVSAIESGYDVACDDELALAIKTPARLDPALDRLAAHPDRGSLVFRALPALEEHRFRSWFQRVLQMNRGLNTGEATTLGRLIASRNWEDAARELADAIIDRGRQDLRPAIDYVVELIGIIRRYELDELGNSIPVAAKWSIVEEIALELYGYGPGDGALWQRAGGKESDIPKLETGRASWRKVLGDAQKGKGDIDIGKLLKRMSDDYPHHRMLQKLRSDPLFRFQA